MKLPKDIGYQLSTIHMCLTDYEKTQGKTGFGDIAAKKKALDYVLSDPALPEPFVAAVQRAYEAESSIGYTSTYYHKHLSSSKSNAVNAIHEAYASEAKPSEDTRSFNEPREAVGIDLDNILRTLKSIDDVLLKHNIQFKFVIKF